MKKPVSSRLLIGFISLFLIWPVLNLVKEGLTLDVNAISSVTILKSVGVTLVTSLVSMSLIILIGLPVGYYLSALTGWRRHFFEIILQIPLMLPPAVIGLILLLAYGNDSLIGRALSFFNIRTSFSSVGVVLVFVFVALPVFIKGVMTAFSTLDKNYIQTAQLLGDSPRRVFWRVSLPLAKPSLLLSVVLAFSRGIAEFGATMMFAGNLQGVTQTMPLAIYSALDTNVDEAIVIALILLVLALVLLHVISWINQRGDVHVNRKLNT